MQKPIKLLILNQQVLIQFIVLSVPKRMRLYAQRTQIHVALPPVVNFVVDDIKD